MYRVRTLLLATLILTVWTMPAHAQEPPPSPEQWMTRGAGVLPQGRHGFLFSAGLPSLEARFILPVNAYMEVNPVVRFGYVVGTSMVFNPSITAGAELKFNVFQRGGHRCHPFGTGQNSLDNQQSVVNNPYAFF
ncbi:MAG TPA: hypothetical protein PLY68_01145 [Myxococcota bacterium]|nr:hypothetical protein [Myxococcota bacterium]HPB49783.1 hypothetical protein [Myxococcota bacterium]HQP94783.1 hypothetical protein [Myxococcota bacterium]